MFCTKCGKQLAENANFCSNCGAQAFEKYKEPKESSDTARAQDTPSQNPTQKKKLSIMALVGFIVSMASLITFPLPGGIVGLVLSRKGRKEIEAQGLDGRGFASAGIAVGIVNIVIGAIRTALIIFLICYVIWAAVTLSPFPLTDHYSYYKDSATAASMIINIH